MPTFILPLITLGMLGFLLLGSILMVLLVLFGLAVNDWNERQKRR
jgi:hypothetical protein